jgi:uncharacterized protein
MVDDTQVVRRAYNAFGQGDFETFAGLFSAGAVWTLPGKSRIAGQYNGPQEILTYLGTLFELAGGDVKVDLEHVASDGEVTFAQHRLQASRDGARVDSKTVLVIRVRDALIAEVWESPFDLGVVDEFWA